jgi:hypothetical protein
MRDQHPFLAADLLELEAFLDEASAVVAMEDAAGDFTDESMIALRHDVDNAIGPAVEMAQWEAERGYRATYFILHTAPYWQEKDTLQAALETIAGCGHEIGFHINAISEAITTGEDPFAIAAEAVDELRGYGHEVHGVVPHGDPLCHVHGFVNDELFTESPRPICGEPDRWVAGVKLQPVSRATLGFDYDPNWLPRAVGVSDSGGRWSQPFEELVAGFPYEGQVHMLIHPVGGLRHSLN